jgi:hypothetical protein
MLGGTFVLLALFFKHSVVASISGLLNGTGPFVPKKGRVFPQCPMLFVFGEKKPIMFHSQKCVDTLNATPGSKACGLPGGHWFFVGRQQAKTVELMRKFLNK